MNTRTAIIPKPLSIENGNNIINFSSKNVSLCFNNEIENTFRNKIKTAFSITGTDISENGIPVFIEISQNADS